MKQIKLKALEIRNFKGIKESIFTPEGRNAIFSGKNETRKTTHFDGWLWLLFGKDSLNRSSFEIKELDGNGNIVEASRKSDHEVKGAITVDGQDIELRRVYKEKWTSKKSSIEKTHTGHTTDYFINGVPSSESEYKQYIAGIIDEETFRLLSDVRYFNEQLKWPKRREILMNAFGDVSDTEVLEANRKLKKLPEILGNHTLDDYRKIIKARMTKIKDEAGSVRVRIDENLKAMPDISTVDVPALESDLVRLKALKTEKETELLNISAGGQVAELTKRLREVEGQIQAKENEFEANKRNRIRAAQAESDKIFMQLTGKKRTVENLNAHIKLLSQNIEDREAKLPVLRAEWKAEHAKQLIFEASGTCPTCGQDIPPEKLESAYQEAQAKFNQKKALVLADNVACGKSYTTEIANFKADIANAEKKIEALQPDIQAFEEKFNAIEEQIKAINEEKPSPDGVFSGKADGLRARIQGLGTADDTRAQKQKLTEEVQAIETQASENFRLLSLVETACKNQARIDELMDQEKTLAAESERLEGELSLTDEFIRERANLLETKIRNRFKITRFKMFDIQVNGEINDQMCEAMVNGVPYATNLNNGSRINCGADIINTLSLAYGVSVPLWIDNAESVTDMIEVDTQTIKMFVKESQKTLKIIIEEPKHAAKAA